MDPVHSLAVQFSLASLDALPAVQPDDVASIFESLKPYICEPLQLAAIKQMSVRQYYQAEPAGLFTQDEAKKVAQIVSSVLAQNKGPASFHLARKTSGIDWKVTVSLQDIVTCVLLLPKKGLFHDLVGTTKRGRISLSCVKETSGFTWKSCIVWNLTSKRKNQAVFLESRQIEERLFKAVGPGYFAQPLFDLVYMDASQRRTCYYEKLSCFLYWRSQETGVSLQQLILGAAQKIAALHAKEIVVVDLKIENMLFRKNGDVLLCDIDQILFNEYERRPGNGGTLELYPPELLEYGFTDGKSGDVFALGCMILELLLGSGPPWLASKQKRRFDRETLDKYRKLAVKARNQLMSEEVTSAKKVLFYLAQWALHPWRTERPSMGAICKYLACQYNGQEELLQAEVEEFLAIEQQNSL